MVPFAQTHLYLLVSAHILPVPRMLSSPRTPHCPRRTFTQPSLANTACSGSSVGQFLVTSVLLLLGTAPAGLLSLREEVQLALLWQESPGGCDKATVKCVLMQGSCLLPSAFLCFQSILHTDYICA